MTNRGICCVFATQPEDLFRFMFTDHVSGKDGRLWNADTRTQLLDILHNSVEDLDHRVGCQDMLIHRGYPS